MAEFNRWVDHEVADILARANHPQMWMVGLNVTQTALLDRPWTDELRTLTGGTATVASPVCSSTTSIGNDR